MRLITVEEYWPGQKPNIRTARIEIWPEGPEVGRITTPSELFDEVREVVERTEEDWRDIWEM